MNLIPTGLALIACATLIAVAARCVITHKRRRMALEQAAQEYWDERIRISNAEAAAAREADRALGIEVLDPRGGLLFRCGTCNKRVKAAGLPAWGSYCTTHKPIAVAEIAPPFEKGPSGQEMLAHIQRRIGKTNAK